MYVCMYVCICVSAKLGKASDLFQERSIYNNMGMLYIALSTQYSGTVVFGIGQEDGDRSRLDIPFYSRVFGVYNDSQP